MQMVLHQGTRLEWEHRLVQSNFLCNSSCNAVGNTSCTGCYMVHCLHHNKSKRDFYFSQLSLSCKIFHIVWYVTHCNPLCSMLQWHCERKSKMCHVTVIFMHCRRQAKINENNMYLLAEWEWQAGKYLAWGPVMSWFLNTLHVLIREYQTWKTAFDLLLKFTIAQVHSHWAIRKFPWPHASWNDSSLCVW